MTGSVDAEPLADRYRRYLAVCNGHAFDQLGDFVSAEVCVNDEPIGLAGYVSGLVAVVAAFPDYHWELGHLLVADPWLSAQFVDTGTHTGAPFLGVPASGRRVRTHELALYRWADRRIVEVFVAADNVTVLAQLGRELDRPSSSG